MTDAQGNGPEGVVDRKVLVQEGNALHGPGPSGPGSETPRKGEGNDYGELDNIKWRGVRCDDTVITSYTHYTPA